MFILRNDNEHSHAGAGVSMNAPRFFRRLCGIAGLLMLTVTWLAPAHAITPPGPPRTDLVPWQEDRFLMSFAPPQNLGDPKAMHVHIRWRQVGWRDEIWETPGRWNNPNGAAGFSQPVGTFVTTNPTGGFIVNGWADRDGKGGYVGSWELVNGRQSPVAGPVGASSTWEVQMAYSNGVIGEWSVSPFVTTGTPVKRLTPSAARGASGFKIEWTVGEYGSFTGWSVPATPATGHRVRWRKQGGNSYAYSADLLVDARSHIQPGLETGATYYVSVAGINNNGTGPYTDEVPVIAGGAPYVKAWAGKAGGIDARAGAADACEVGRH